VRNLIKLEEPAVLHSHCQRWLEEFVADQGNFTKRCRYRHPEIKATLKKETGYKCIYCESKIGHNSPGDIEHKIPSSKHIEFHFTWDNLTIACAECNRRKNSYFEEGNAFLDPYSDDVESLLEHYGPLVYWRTNENRSEITVRILELNSKNRQELIERKIGKIDEFTNLLERYVGQNNHTLRELLWKQIEEMTLKSSEYSAMLLSILHTKGITNAAIRTSFDG
jgi:5-methylcytosine-specific restriction endonuclease McrA|tara:strand:- start:2483 stop:3151 length:669 start_codon:yes stop_codon:yes gene_type:complete